MKEGWEYKKLGEVCEIIRGKRFVRADIVEDGVPCIHYGDIYTHYGLSVTKTKGFVNPELAKKLRFAKKNDVVVVQAGENNWDIGVGVAYFGEEPAVVHDACFILRHTQNPMYISYYLRSYNYHRYLVDYVHEGKICSFLKPALENAPFPLPPLSEQQSIVDYLDSAFAKIDAMKANAEKALNEAKALFQASLKEMLEPKEGTFIRGGNFSKKDFVEDGYPCIHYGQIHTKFGVATFEHLSCVPETMVKKERCASKGDLVIAITSEDDEGSCKCTAWMADYDAYVGGHTAIFKHNLNPIYVSYYFKAARFQKDKLDYTHGFKVVEISPKDIAKILICYPSAEEQQSIVETLDSLKSKVDRLQANYDKISQECDALKQAILRQVFE